MSLTPPDLPEGSIWGIGASAVAALLWLRTKLSKQNVEVTEDSAKISLIEVLQKERDQARHGEAEARKREDDAWKARAEDAKLIGELSMQVKNLAKINETLEQQVATMREELHKMRDELATLKTGQQLHQLRNGETPT